jgi:plastocyanin
MSAGKARIPKRREGWADGKRWDMETRNHNESPFMAKIVIKVGQKVTWKDSSEVIHNVVDDAGKAINKADVHVPEGGKPFDSGLMQPGQTFARVFRAPGVYRYVCMLHEANGMKGVVVVR